MEISQGDTLYASNKFLTEYTVKSVGSSVVIENKKGDEHTAFFTSKGRIVMDSSAFVYLTKSKDEAISIALADINSKFNAAKKKRDNSIAILKRRTNS